MHAPFTNSWRFISHPAQDGPWNMAADEAILRAVADQNAPPTLRLYAWDPTCLSLGYAQPFMDVDQDRITEYGWDLVRRPTGGRAILHQHEITYAIIAPQDHPLMRGGVLESYRRISQALVSTLERLAISVEVKPSSPASEEQRNKPICFEVPSAYEITVNGRKIIGSAQVRRRNTVLQHGSLPLSGDISQICDVLRYQNETQRDEAKSKLRQQATTIYEITGREISWREASHAFQQGFQSALNAELSPDDLNQAELESLEKLHQERYRSPSWTSRVLTPPEKL